MVREGKKGRGVGGRGGGEEWKEKGEGESGKGIGKGGGGEERGGCCGSLKASSKKKASSRNNCRAANFPAGDPRRSIAVLARDLCIRVIHLVWKF